MAALADFLSRWGWSKRTDRALQAHGAALEAVQRAERRGCTQDIGAARRRAADALNARLRVGA